MMEKHRIEHSLCMALLRKIKLIIKGLQFARRSVTDMENGLLLGHVTNFVPPVSIKLILDCINWTEKL